MHRDVKREQLRNPSFVSEYLVRFTTTNLKKDKGGRNKREEEEEEEEKEKKEEEEEDRRKKKKEKRNDVDGGIGQRVHSLPRIEGLIRIAARNRALLREL
ncbi:hypothetical protein HZH66_014556 [Vespula vulgaris]|uniref:Uncharacterized protein n=1 Tax=Vespula vulgaris TaxID=7454 RepID=A0A834J2Z8_VESVU|nr:hypothetical protein HZH66_014556 [Vespula vulgaris]